MTTVIYEKLLKEMKKAIPDYTSLFADMAANTPKIAKLLHNAAGLLAHVKSQEAKEAKQALKA